MEQKKITTEYENKEIWMISKGKVTDINTTPFKGEILSGTVSEYRISGFARYLLNPRPIEVEKKLIGCEVRFRQTLFSKALGKIRGLFPVAQKEKGAHSETFVSNLRSKNLSIRDRELGAHIDRIKSLLKPYDPMVRRLLKLDRDQIFQITGICEEDIEGNRSWLTLKGTISEKIGYICRYIGEDIKVVLEKAYVAEALFELRGFDFTTYDPGQSYRLLKFDKDNVTHACVIGPDNQEEFRVDDLKLLWYMHLLEQAIQTNPNFLESLNLCIQGKAKPLRILFNKQMEIDYSRARLPEVYREAFNTCQIPLEQTVNFMDSLKNLQIGISFQYIPASVNGDKKLFTNISVMHDFRALEPIKDNLPQLYSEINKRVSVSEAGRFYLLDAIKGYKDE